MTQIESEVTQERQLAKTLVDLRQSYTRAKMLLPAVGFAEMMLLAGAVEQAKSEGMSARKGRPPLATTVPLVPRLSSAEGPGTRLMVSKGKGVVVSVLRALTDLLKEHKKPMSVRDILEGLAAKSWVLNSSSDHIDTILRCVLTRHRDIFKSVKKGNRIQYMARQEPVKRVRTRSTAKATPAVEMKPVKRIRPSRVKNPPKVDSSKLRGLAVTTLMAHHGKPLTLAALAEKMGVDDARRIVALLSSLQKHGGVKQIKKDDTTIVWSPIRDTLKTLGGKTESSESSAQNGVSHA